jgi:hypothetical protein
VWHRTAKNALPWDGRTTHGNEFGHGKGAHERTATKGARQRRTLVHDKQQRHGKGRSKHTAKASATAKAHSSTVHRNYAVRRRVLHGKGAFAVRQPFAVRILAFSKKIISVLFFLLLMFNSQLVLYFIDFFSKWGSPSLCIQMMHMAFI